MKRATILSLFFKRHLFRFYNRFRHRNTWLLLFGDIVSIFIAHIFAHALRFEFQIQQGDLEHFIFFIPLLVAIRIPIYYMMGLYSGMWRYTGMSDLGNIAKAVLFSTLVLISILLFDNRFEGYSRGIIIIDTFLTFLFVCGLRVGIRYFLQGQPIIPQPHKKTRIRKLLIIGAGGAAEKVTREIFENNLLNYEIVGFLDDDPKKNGMRIHNIPVLGNIDKIEECVNTTESDEILIAISSISSSRMQRIVSLSKAVNVPFKIIPGYGEVIDGKVSIGIRDVSYKDLLGRDEVQLDVNKIGNYLSGKTILVTGGGGSIGSELIRQIIRYTPSELIIFDAGEENLYNIQMELLHEHDFKEVIPVLGKVQDISLLNYIFKKYQPNVVFHAAAYKHVPLVELNPWQAVDNNILASQRIIEAAIIFGVERFVLVSTDKAVRPTNVMGASKRMVELLMSAYQEKHWQGKLSTEWNNYISIDKVNNKTVFSAVRFGNVLGSSGSVIPLFKRQIENGGPVTVTDAEVTRYFMSIEEAAQLILQAGAMAEGGEIFILKMGSPIKIADIAKELIELFGKKVNEDIHIEYIGLRPGEKLYEELITEGENVIETGHQKIMVLTGDNTLTDKEAIEAVNNLSVLASNLDGESLLKSLKQLIPEYSERPEVNVN